jgi:hypothetical protein
MIKPNIPNIPGIPGIGAMTDTLDFVKNLWSSMGIPGMNMSSMPGMNMPGMSGIPGMVMPTLSVEEITKKISDLKTVESWLGLNMTMLRGTIQALEVQAATISTLQTMGESFTASMTPGVKDKAADEEPAASARTGNGSTGSHESEKLHGAPQPTSKDESDAASLTAPLVNAAAWWNMLQDQFKQAVSNAMVDVPVPAAPAAEKPKARTKAKAEPAPAPAASAPRKRSKTTK